LKVTPYSLVDREKRFDRTGCLHLPCSLVDSEKVSKEQVAAIYKVEESEIRFAVKT
jgi:hypothetical protein